MMDGLLIIIYIFVVIVVTEKYTLFHCIKLYYQIVTPIF